MLNGPVVLSGPAVLSWAHGAEVTCMAHGTLLFPLTALVNTQGSLLSSTFLWGSPLLLRVTREAQQRVSLSRQSLAPGSLAGTAGANTRWPGSGKHAFPSTEHRKGERHPRVWGAKQSLRGRAVWGGAGGAAADSQRWRVTHGPCVHAPASPTGQGAQNLRSPGRLAVPPQDEAARGRAGWGTIFFSLS